MSKKFFIRWTQGYTLIFLITLISCNKKGEGKVEQISTKVEVQQYLNDYNLEYEKLYYENSIAQWQSNIRIVEGDTTNAYNSKKANEALAKFTGSKENIERAKKYLDEDNRLDTLQIRQLKTILFNAANNPETASDDVKKRIEAETVQNEKLYGFNFEIKGKPVSTNQIDEILKKETDLNKRLNAWVASKEVGKVLKPGLIVLRELRNKTVQSLGYRDFFAYQVSEYDMPVDDMLKMNQQLIRDIWPLYRELHTYARYELAKKFHQKEIPEFLPAHWLPNRWGQDWSAMINIEGLDIDKALKKKDASWMVKEAEMFYVSLGFDPLPKVFWEKSSLYPLSINSKYKKNNHASAWHMDLQNDVRSIMSVEPNAEWYETTHHELGHIYYYLSYTNPSVPPLLRTGANRAFHEAVGSMMGLAALQKPFLINKKLIAADVKTDETKELLKEALNYITFIPFSAGVMTEFEHELYAKGLSKDGLNRKWWDLVKKYQGIVPPNFRGEEFCDAASKTHINDDPAQYYDYALSFALLFQLHDHIGTKILKQNPKATNYYGNKEVGDFLKKILSPGANCDWRVLIKENTGKEINGESILYYFQPLMTYLKEVNKGRKYTLEEKI